MQSSSIIIVAAPSYITIHTKIEWFVLYSNSHNNRLRLFLYEGNLWEIIIVAFTNFMNTELARLFMLSR